MDTNNKQSGSQVHPESALPSGGAASGEAARDTIAFKLALDVQHPDCHKAADAFWSYWNENGETHKRGYYESTWGAINRAIRMVGVAPWSYGQSGERERDGGEIRVSASAPDVAGAGMEDAAAGDIDALVLEYVNAPVTGSGRTRRVVRQEIYHLAGEIFGSAAQAAPAVAAEAVPADDGLAVLIAAKLAQLDGVTEEELGQIQWRSGSAPEPMGDRWTLDYYPKGRAIAEAIAGHPAPVSPYLSRSIRDHADFREDLERLSTADRKTAKAIRKSIYDTIDARVDNAVKSALAASSAPAAAVEAIQETVSTFLQNNVDNLLADRADSLAVGIVRVINVALANEAAASSAAVAQPAAQAVEALTPLDYRAQGREEALDIILQEDPEEPFGDFTSTSQNGDSGDYSTHWDEDALRKLLHIEDRKHDVYDRAEAMYWEALGHKDEADQMRLMVERAPFYKPLHDFLSKHEAWDLLADLKRTEVPAAPEAPQAVEPTAPHILEAISWHANERDDLTLEDAVSALRFGWTKVRGRTERAMLIQLVDLMASAPAAAQQAAHADDLAVDRFAVAMKDKMARSRAKGRGGWDDPAQCSAQELQTMLLDHLAKGDPVDVGNFCMMLWNRGERTEAAHASTAGALELVGYAREFKLSELADDGASGVRMVIHKNAGEGMAALYRAAAGAEAVRHNIDLVLTRLEQIQERPVPCETRALVDEAMTCALAVSRALAAQPAAAAQADQARDADRYRTLRNHIEGWYVGPDYDVTEGGLIENYDNKAGAELDAAVDAAMAAAAPGGEKGGARDE
jgi:hypothetical protein